MSSLDIYMMRHGYDDHSYIDGKNDTSLTPKGIETAKIMSKAHAQFLQKYCDAPLQIYASSKRRAIETAEILSNELSSNKIEHELVIEDRFRELYQGHMQGLDGKTHEERVHALEIGWEIFDRERLANNHDYKYGTPDYYNTEYTDFNNFIAPPYGESQNDFSSRIQGAFLDILENSVCKNIVPLLVVHRGTVREILNVTKTYNSGIEKLSQNPDIEMAGWKYCELFHDSILDTKFSISALRKQIEKYSK